MPAGSGGWAFNLAGDRDHLTLEHEIEDAPAGSGPRFNSKLERVRCIYATGNLRFGLGGASAQGHLGQVLDYDVGAGGLQGVPVVAAVDADDTAEVAGAAGSHS